MRATLRPRDVAVRSASLTIASAILVAQVSQAPSPSRDWPQYHGDRAGTGYSALSQITTANVSHLAQVWAYRLQSAAPAAPGGRVGGTATANSQATPLVAGGVMYLPTANGVAALEPETGRELWDTPVSGGTPSRNGVAYWGGEGSVPPRIIFTAGRRLIALDASTGAAVPAFGNGGEVDLVVPYNAVPLVYRNIIVVGANAVPGGAPTNARAFDARTGARLWEFNSVPLPGEFGHSTWEGDSWRSHAGVNPWSFYFTLDEARGLVYIPVASPKPGAYGGDRRGDNLFGTSLVALDVQTGRYRWHFQATHHDLWDADPPAPPSLFDIVRDGRTIPALALTTKSGYLYVLNRETGAPVYGVEERAVPKSDVPGEFASPTQPIPVKPPAIARVGFNEADLVTAADTTAGHAAACQALVQTVGGVSNSGPFTPWRYRAEGETAGSTLAFPGGLGGANWGGSAYDPNTHFVFVATQDLGALGWIEKAPAGSAPPYAKATIDRGAFDVSIGDSRWPCQRPPWGRLIAVDTTTGDFAWQVPLGITEELPAGKQNTGRPLVAGPIVSAGGIVFIASTDDNRFRALDARTGRELWVTKLERRGNADAMTYQGRDGKQYVAVVATDSLLVYALP